MGSSVQLWRGVLFIGLFAWAGVMATAAETGGPRPANAPPDEAAQEAATGVDGEEPRETTTDETTTGESTGDAAIEKQEAAIDDPETRALLVRAEEHYYRGRYHIALKLFQLVIEREPEHPLAYRYAGDILLRQGDLDRAAEHLHIARELSAHPEQEWFRLGQVAYLRGDADAATDAFETALELRPDFAICRFYLGFVSYRLRRDKTATIDHWENYRRMSPDDPQGPAIDRALEILRNPDYEIPDFNGQAQAAPALPDGGDTRVPYQPGRAEDQKSDNTGEDIIELDDL